MSTKKKKKSSSAGLNIAINLVTLSVIFVFVGYLLGQYAVNMLKEQHNSKVATTVTQAPASASSPVLPTPTPITTPAPAPLAPTPAPTTNQSTEVALYRVQVGVFSEKANADRMVKILKDDGYEAIIVGGPPYRVQTGAFSSQENANRLMEELKKRNYEAIVVR